MSCRICGWDIRRELRFKRGAHEVYPIFLPEPVWHGLEQQWTIEVNENKTVVSGFHVPDSYFRSDFVSRQT